MQWDSIVYWQREKEETYRFMKNVVVLGSNRLDREKCLGGFVQFSRTDSVVFGISTNVNINLLEEQIRSFKPKMAVVMDEESFQRFPRNLRHGDIFRAWTV